MEIANTFDLRLSTPIIFCSSFASFSANARKSSHYQLVQFHLLLNLSCYDSMLEMLSKELTLVLSGTRELNRELLLQTSLPYIVLQTVCANYCVPYSKQPCGVHVVWHHLFSNLLLNSPKSCDLSCDYTIRLWLMWQYDQSVLTLSCSNNRKVEK